MAILASLALVLIGYDLMANKPVPAVQNTTAIAGESIEDLPTVDYSALNLENRDDYDLTDLVGTASTSFKGSSADRIKNITIGASKVNGQVVLPGAEFSLVEAIGYVTEEDGYTEEFVIKDGQSVKEFGGGLCQIATTLFRSTLDAGLPVTERKNHSYVVGYYGPGLDATIYGPHPDLRFVNDTGRPLVLEGYVVEDRLVFNFYGKDDGRRVTISEPEITDEINPPPPRYISTSELPPAETFCVENPRKGLTAKVDYTVQSASGESKTQTFKSTYVPWQKVCYIGLAK